MDGGAPSIAPRAADPVRPMSGGDRRDRLVPLVCGAVTLALGSVVIIGWHTGNDRLVRVLPGYRPMVYLTAVCFLLSGLTLLFRHAGRKWLASLSSTLTLGIAAVELLKNRGVEIRRAVPVLHDPSFRDLTNLTMAPITAVGFFLIGVSLLLSSLPGFPRRPALVGAAGALTLGFSSVALMGYVAGTSAYQWTPLAGMAVHTAVGLFLLATAVLVISRVDDGGAVSRRPPWLLLAVGVASTLSLWWGLVAQERFFIERALKTEAESFASRLSSEVRERALALFRMSKRWEQRGEVPRAEWEADAHWYDVHQPGSRAFEWADSSLHVRWVTPTAGNEGEAGLDVRGDPRRREAIDRALATGSVRTTRAFPLPAGGAGFAIVSPITAGPSSGSLLMSVIEFRGLCDTLFAADRSRGRPFELLDGQRVIYQGGAPLRASPDLVRDASTDANTVPVRVRVWASPELLASPSRLPTVALVLGLLITALLAISVHFGRMARDRARLAEALNQSWSSEMMERHRAEATVVERIRLADFAAEVGFALTRRSATDAALAECARAMVRAIGASTATVWTMNERTGQLEFAADAGFEDRPDDARHAGGAGTRLGRIARDQQPVLVSRLGPSGFAEDEGWARESAMDSFAGYPLTVGQRTVGVVALFSRHGMDVTALHALGTVADMIALAIDRAHASAALEANEMRTRAVIDNMVGGLITTDRHARIETVNPAAEKMFGYAAAELVGANLGVLVPFPEGANPREYLREAMRKSLGKVTEWAARRKDGSIFPMELALAPFETADGAHFSGSVRDISERTEIDRMKNEFVSTVSHELRTPLTSIRGSLGLLSGGVLGELSDDAKEVVALAERNVVRLVGLINDILDLERLDTGRLEMTFERVPVAQIFARSFDAVRSFADAQGITLKEDASPALLYADRDRMVQVVVNLLSNAIKFSPPGSTVSASAAENGSGTEIRIADHGRGVPKHHREAIFERFRQVESSDARQKGGSGLGLAISRAIIEQHRGTIGVESEEGQGSVFWIRMPLAPAPMAVGSLAS